MIKLKNILGEISNADNARGTKGYTGFLPSELWDAYMRKLQKSIKNTTGYTIVGLEDLPPDTIKKTDNPINQSDVDDKNISEIIKLKDLLPEGVAHETKTLEQVWTGRIPIYPALMKKVIGDIPIESFHITDWLRAHGLQKLIGKKKSLSTFTALKRDSMQTTGKGIQTSGGIVFHLSLIHI